VTVRLLLVHAHPDDETLNHGATIAAALAHGHDVDVVTCTRGEEGEVIGDAHAHRTSDREDTLGAHREVELAAALEALGTPVPGTPVGSRRGRLTHHWLDHLPADARLTVPARAWPTYRDSGMVVLPGGRAAVPPDVRDDAFAVADLDEAASRLAGLVLRRRPHLVLTYGPHGGYGHPDHVMAHRVTVRAVEVAGRPRGSVPGASTGRGAAEPCAQWQVPWLYAVAGDADELRVWLRERRDPAAWDPDGPLPHMFVAPDLIDATVEADPWLPAKVAALRALPTQVTVLDDTPGRAALALSNEVPQPLTGREHHQLIRPPSPGSGGERPAVAPHDPLAALLR
jgi:N-acetyl-1-D-myo-inositol-2-amino-2-deoxy-alpha-D-glucopyranoside deacetylase